MKNQIAVLIITVLSIFSIQAQSLENGPSLPTLSTQSQLPELEDFPLSKRQVKKKIKRGALTEVAVTSHNYQQAVSDWSEQSLSRYINYWTDKIESVSSSYDNWMLLAMTEEDQLQRIRAVKTESQAVADYLNQIDLILISDLESLAQNQEKSIEQILPQVSGKAAEGLKAASNALKVTRLQIEAVQQQNIALRDAVMADSVLAEKEMWNAFQAALYAALLSDNLIYNPAKFQIAVGEQNIEVNGKVTNSSTYELYKQLFASYEQSLSKGWQYKVNGTKALHGTADNLTEEVFQIGGKDLTSK